MSYESTVPANVAYSHNVAWSAVEPFVSVFGAIDTASWQQQVKRQKILLPGGEDSRLFEAMLTETTGASVTYATPQFHQPTGAGTTVYEVISPSTSDESVYLVTSAHIPGRKAVDQIPCSRYSDGSYSSSGLNDRVIVENDVLGSESINPHLDVLRHQGFRLAGWTPSEREHGNIALVMTRPGFLPAEGIPAVEVDLSAMSGFSAAKLFLEYSAARRPVRAVDN